jgi:hypothetical protein
LHLRTGLKRGSSTLLVLRQHRLLHRLETGD